MNEVTAVQNENTHGVEFISDHRRVEERSIWLHSAIAEKLRADPKGVLAKAWDNLEHLKTHARNSKDYVIAWETLLTGPLQDLLAAMVSPSQEARDLRQCSPFAGVLTPKERWNIYHQFGEGWHRHD